MMTQARRSVRVRSSAAVVLAALVTLGCLSGCSAEKNRDMTVYFKSGTTEATLQHAAAACGHIESDVTPVPFPTPSGAESKDPVNGPEGIDADEILFSVGSANDNHVAQVTNCLDKQPGVLGVAPPDDDMS